MMVLALSLCGIMAHPAAAVPLDPITPPIPYRNAHPLPHAMTIPIANPGTNIFNFEWLGLDILSISMDLEEAAFGLKTELEKVDAPPEIPTPDGSVYAYFEITSNVEPDNLKKGEVKFRVGEEWVRTNGISNDTIKLERHVSGNGWEALPTTEIGADGRAIYFSAEVPAFSLFAITGEKKPGEFPLPTETPIPSPAVPAPEPVLVTRWVVAVAFLVWVMIISISYLLTGQKEA